MKKSIAQYAKSAKAAASRVGDSAKELGRTVGNAAVVKAGSAGSAVASGSRRSATSAKNAAVATGSALAAGMGAAKRSAATAATAAFDQNGDGKFDQDDIKIMAQKGVEVAKGIAIEAGHLAKRAAKSEMSKDAATGAAIGAAVAVPIPLIGPVFGAVVGAGAGLALGLRTGASKKSDNTDAKAAPQAPAVDIHKRLIDLDDLRQKGILSQEEFDVEKCKVLGKAPDKGNKG